MNGHAVALARIRTSRPRQLLAEGDAGNRHRQPGVRRHHSPVAERFSRRWTRAVRLRASTAIQQVTSIHPHHRHGDDFIFQQPWQSNTAPWRVTGGEQQFPDVTRPVLPAPVCTSGPTPAAATISREHGVKERLPTEVVAQPQLFVAPVAAGCPAAPPAWRQQDVAVYSSDRATIGSVVHPRTHPVPRARRTKQQRAAGTSTIKVRINISARRVGGGAPTPAPRSAP